MANPIESPSRVAEHPIDVVVQGSHYTQAFHATAAERAALQAEQLIHLSFDVTLGVDLVLAAVPRVAELKAELAQLPLNPELVERLEVYAWAAAYAHALYVIATAPPAELKPTYEAALKLRAKLYADAVNVARNGLIDTDSVDAISTEVGYHNVGYGLMAVVALFRDNASRVVGRTASEIADWEEADKLAAKLLDQRARRATRREQRSKLAETRLRAISLLVEAYEQIRRAVQYVRYKQRDAEMFAPSIYTAKSPSRKRDDALPITAQRHARRGEHAESNETQLLVYRQQRAPAVVLPEQPPKYSVGVLAPYPQLDQLQTLPSGSEPVAVHTRIGCPVGHSEPTVGDAKHALDPPE